MNRSSLSAASLLLSAATALLLSACGGAGNHPEGISRPSIRVRPQQEQPVVTDPRVRKPKFRIYTNDIPVPGEELPAQDEKPTPAQNPVRVELPPVAPPQPVVSSATVPDEVVTIEGTRYKIPAPWTGNRLKAPVFTLATFQQIPVIHVHAGHEVYIKKQALKPLLAMIIAARKDGVILQAETAYRSYEQQKLIFKRKFKEGRTWDDVVRYVAPPGYSEHMLGTAVDFYPSGWQFASTEAYAWLKKHANHFGFYESYPQRHLPGHLPLAWESWHWRYLGSHGPVTAPAGTAPQPRQTPVMHADGEKAMEQAAAPAIPVDRKAVRAAALAARASAAAAEIRSMQVEEPVVQTAGEKAATQEDAAEVSDLLDAPPDPGELPPPPPGTDGSL